MSSSRSVKIWLSAAASVALIGMPAMGAGTQTFTGKVSDAMCGAKHNEKIDPAACVRECVSKGANYSLVVGDKVYTLETSNQANLDALNKLAWSEARVTGTAKGDTIEVKSVTAAK